MSKYLDEAQLEIVTVDYFRELGYEYLHGPAIAPDGDTPERQDSAQVVLTRWLRDAMVRINPDVPDDAARSYWGRMASLELQVHFRSSTGG